MVDKDGFRPNVGMILINHAGQLFWGRRIGMDAWQFPQGGIQQGEDPEAALYRELKEEVGLSPEHVEIIGRTSDWLRYRLPKHAIQHFSSPLCIGQKQIWFLLKLLVDEQHINVNQGTPPEFDGWDWVDFWTPIQNVVSFKQQVYRQALTELAPLFGRWYKLPQFSY